MTQTGYMSPWLRRTITLTMSAAVGMILAALVLVGFYFKQESSRQSQRAAVAAADRITLEQRLNEATVAIERLDAFIKDTDGQRAKALAAAVKQVTDAQEALIRDLFAKERAVSKAEADRQLAAIRAAQADLEKRIAAILQGPPGPSGPQGPAGEKGKCQVLCL